MRTTATLGTLRLRPLLTGGGFSEVAYIIKIEIGPLKRWPLKAGVRYAKVAVSSGLTTLSSFSQKRLGNVAKIQ